MSKERKTPAVLGLDMGGTHTDAVLLRGGTLLASVKVPTNHQDLLVSTREALHALFESGAAFPADVSRATFGTTLAVNAVVQDACAPVGLLIGAGAGPEPGRVRAGGPYGARSRRRGSPGDGSRASGSGGYTAGCERLAGGRAGRVRLRRQVFDAQSGA